MGNRECRNSETQHSTSRPLFAVISIRRKLKANHMEGKRDQGLSQRYGYDPTRWKNANIGRPVGSSLFCLLLLRTAISSDRFGFSRPRPVGSLFFPSFISLVV
jgi:hypothetical protein